MRVLVTRPAEDQARTAAALAERGHHAIEVPVMRIASLDIAPLPSGATAIAATSAHAFRSCAGVLTDAIRALPAFVVGDHTAEAARAAGFFDVASAGADAVGLLDLLARAAPSPGAIIYLAGSPRRDTLEGDPRLAGRLQVVETYRAVGVPDFPERLVSAGSDGWPDVALHFSAHQAGLLAGFLADRRLQPLLRARHLAISAQAGAPLNGLVRWTAAERPTLAGLLDLL